ncbi:Spy0128 family protein [Collinsella aerofaciens]|uniref:Spy0128 family protein n=1 Tax=Collinsella aerofaciens TaxID=74426 RepID=UPI003DA580A2
MSYDRRRGLRPVSPYAIVLALAIALTASFFLPTRAEAKVSDHTVPFPNHMVPTISPSGTTINLFDYWVNSEDHLSVSGSDGINKGHRFKFKDQGASEDLNRYTGGSSPRSGIVNNVLTGGYPKLTDSWGGESLGYLFDSSAQTGKISHMGVTGLLQAKGGYYEYDSSKNYAAYNVNKNAFDVYEVAGVGQAGAGSQNGGQFFPFDAADKVFKEENGRLVRNGITSSNNGDSNYNDGKPLNHYFGLSMSSRFVQPTDGKTNAGDPMTFEFAGDDDVWVFIDDVLVGDIGGIHTSAKLTIDFQTGQIKVNDSPNGTLLRKFQEAGRGTSGFTGNTFANDTSHTLKFFYLERGATDSNMKLKYNLVTVPESDIIKFDQDGGLVEGAQFELYKTDKSFADTTTNSEKLLGSGTTDANGQLTLTNKVDNGVINFDDLYSKDHNCRYYLLKETKVPEGHRSSLTATDGSMQFEYVPASDENGAGGVIINRGGMDADSSVWQSGAFAGSKETITAPSTVYQADDDSMKPGNTVDMKRGTLFAVVFKRDKSKNAWHAVSGDPTKGYTLAGAQGMAGAIEAAKKDLYAFTLNTSGQYQVEIPYLPGDISKYYYLLSGDARKNAEYAVAIYYTTASSIADANTDNTVHVFSDDLPGDQVNFKRQFATSLLVTNIQNRLFVQKTDTEGNPVDGAKFGLYTDGQVTTDANGKVVLNGDQIPYDTLTTGQVSNPIQLEGAGIFPCTSDGNKPLVKGAYFLKEVSAPKGFLLNDTLTKVIVDDYGVHADAGTADDGVSTFVGPGTLMKSLGQFGAEGDIDNTLTWIKGMRQTSDGVTDGGNLSWSDVDSAGAGDTVHLKYGANGRIYQYGPTKAGEPYRLETETGWIRMGITQDEPGVTNAKGARADLGDMNLNALFTGATCVRVANEREASLEVTKKVDVPDGLTGNKDAGFTFNFTVPAGKTYKAAVFEKAGTAGERRVGNVFNLTNGYSQTIKADETIRVYGLSEGDEYTVQELTGADQMPAGYKLTGRKQGATDLKDAGDSVTGKIAKQNTDGTLAEANKLVFTNTYTAEASDKLTPQVTKKISGTERTDKKFSFTLAATSKTKDKIDAGDLEDDGLKGDTPSESKTTKGEITGKDGQPLNFSDMTFNKAGDYTFTLTEAHGEDDDPNTTGAQNAGWTMDDSTYTVTVKVEDKNAKLTVTGVAVEKDGDDKSETLEVKKGKVNLATFTNSYAAKGSVTLAAKKHFTGGALAGNDFSFALYKGDKAEGTPLETVTNDENGNITFQPINYTEAGDYDYTIKEVKGADPTVVYDGQEVKVKVSVTDNKNGTLGATATYGGDEVVPTFTNSKPTTDVTVEATKTLTGKALTDGAFAFGLYDQAGNEVAKGANDRDGKVKLTVKGLNLGEYDYTLKEVAGSDSTITYDSTEVRVHVSVKAEGDKAKATVTYDGKNDIPTFKNTYQPAETSVTLAAKKAYVKSDSTPAALKGGEFAFDLYEGDLTAEQLKGKQPIRSAKNGEDGTVTFPAINYTKAGEYKYTIVEKKGDLSHVTFDDAVHHAAVKVMDKAGKLDAAVAYDGDKADAPTFTNTYTAKGSVELTATKVVAVAPGFTHDTKLKGGEYTFELKDADGKVLDTAKNEADGTVKFTRDFELADLGGAASKDFAYTIAEKTGAEAGMVYDNHTLTYTVTVTDDGAGTLTATPQVTSGDKTFTNTYHPKETSVTLKATKRFTGGELAGSDFTFQLLDKDGSVVQTVQNEKDGKVAFAAIDYATPGDHDYTIKEVKGADSTVVYDAKGVKVHVKVTDEKGELKATVTYDGEKAVPTFTNTKPTADVTVEATKVLAGKDLTADAFTFGLYDQDGNEDARGTNDKNGKVKLTVKGLNLGEYDYTLKEVAGSDSTITYDSTEVRVHVSVKAEGDKAKATVTYDGKNDIPTFKNTYQPAETSVTLAAKKAYVKSDSTPAALKGGEFAFDLYEGDLTAEQLKGKQPIRSAKNGEDGTVTFPAINYTKAGEYKYTIVEKKGDLSHVTFDDAVHHAAVKVMDKAGKLDAAVAYDGDKADAPTFTNTYTAKGSVELTATKVVAVAPGFTHDTKLKGGEYTFELKDADGKVLDTAKNEADGTVKFTRDFELADLGGAASKDFAYTIAEKTGAEAGMVYDNHTLTYTVTVTDDGAGTLTATPQVTSGDKTFTNTYHPKETSVTLKATKRFTGGELAGSDFTFQLLDKDGSVVQTVQNEKDGKVAFAAIDYATPGDHDYTIKEVKGADSTVVYDAKGVKVHVKVTDEKGELKATVTYDGEKAVPTFTNTKPTADVTVEATKVLAGKDLTADAFTFGLYDQDGNEDARGTNDKNGKVKLTVKGLNLGEYDYTLKEEKAGQSVDGVAYDAKKVKVYVKVEQNQDDNNKTKVTVTYDGTATAPTFNNTYTAKGSVALTATKTIKVADGFDHTTKPADGEFTFDLKDAAGNVIATAKNDANGKVCFTREFQLSDLDGAASKDFTYTIVEQPGAEPGMVYDNHALTYTVTVTDGGNGALNAKAIVTSASGSDTFTNTYQPAATGLALGAQKSYVKKDDNTPIVPKDGEFTFDVYEGKMTAEQLAGAKPVRTATNGADGSVNFDAFSYAKPGTYEYTIVERKGDLAYVTYDDAVHHAVVTVVDNAGTLQASVAYDGADATKPTFTNTYKAKATNSGAIALTKSVDVHDGSYQLKAGDFAFELVGSDGTVLQTQKNDAKGKVYFNELTFDHAGTFPFTVREVQPTDGAPGVPGVTYTGKTYTLTYVVKDNNDGKLVVESSTVKPSEGTENGVTPNTMTFANSYQPGQTSYQISGTKVLENADPATTRTPADGEFTFALIDVATGQEIDRTTNVGKAFTFKAISYTATGSHAYQVKEVAGQDGTITYSDAVLDVTVNVTDDGSGQLTATANKTAADLTFTNTYTPTATTATITGTKALTGRDLAEGEFFFDLKDADGNVVQTVQNGADGTFGFAPLQLDKVGTYVYTVSERAGATANGVTYDTTVFTATVTVTENAETHALEAQVAYSKGGKAADAVAFSNSYAPAATEVKLGASKVLSGEDLKEGQFSFQLKDADGKVLQTAKNAADGTVGFEAISYDKPGTYAYSISEVDDGQKNVTYDAAEHRVTVTVTDDGAGHLVATVTYDGAVAPVFKNTYTPPTTPPTEPPTNPPSKSPVPKEEKPGLPYTGDTSLSPMALGGIAGGAVVLIAAGVILRRRNR